MSKTQRCSRGMVLAAAAVAIIVCGTVAYGDPIRFDNPAPGEAGYFHWPPDNTWDFRGLDITLPSDSQPPPFSESVFWQFCPSPQGSRVGNSSGGHLQVIDTELVGVASGTLIPSGFEWAINGYIALDASPVLPENEATYLGTRFDLGTGYQYGWIGVVRSGFELETFAWGYETEVGVPIPAGIPEPGTLALLAFGATAALAKRRRR